jgi:hypothetical protein
MPAFNLEIPGSRGTAGSSVDLSQTADLKTFIYTGGQKEIIEVQYSANNADPWVKVVQLGGDQPLLTTHQAFGGFFRVFRAQVDPNASPLVSIIASPLHPTTTFSLNVPTSKGTGTTSDLSGAGDAKTILYRGGAREHLRVECSADGNDPWGVVAVFKGAAGKGVPSKALTGVVTDESVFSFPTSFPTGFLRVNRLNVDPTLLPTVTVAVGPVKPPVATAPVATTSTDNTVTLATYPTYADGVFEVLANVLQRQSTTAFGAIYLHALFHRAGGALSQVGSTATINQIGGVSGASTAFSVSGSNIVLSGTGVSDVPIDWRANLTVNQISP